MWLVEQTILTAIGKVPRCHNLELGVVVESSLRLLPEELIQDCYDAAGFRQVAVLRPGVLEQHIPISAALEELVAAKQGVVTHLSLPHKALQAVHVLDGLQRVSNREEES